MSINTGGLSTSLLGGSPSGAETSLSFESISLTIADRTVLRDVTGSTSSQRLTAILGPSGAGKSSLLNILAGRRTSKGKFVVEGRVYVNNCEVNPLHYRQRIAFVQQEDALFPTQTPREALAFSAALRLPRDLNKMARRELVQAMLESLSLQNCADVFVGSATIPGISGGEKKRTSIGVELISNPTMLFCDEPTSGLDSFAAYNICEILRALSTRRGCAVLATIHQPSSEIFELFDDVLCLSRGVVVYNGPVRELAEFLGGMGHECPPRHNPADFVMMIMQTSNDERLAELAAASASAATRDIERATPPSGQGGPLAGVGESGGRSDERYDLAGGGFFSPSALREMHALSPPWRDQPMSRVRRRDLPGFCVQLGLLGEREMRNVVRDKATLGVRFGAIVFMYLLFGLVFRDVGAPQPADPDATSSFSRIFDHLGALTMIAFGGMFGMANPLLLTFPSERPVFLREVSTGTYGALAYFWSKLLVEVPLAILQSLLIFLVAYWLMGLQGNFLLMVGVVALLGLASRAQLLLKRYAMRG